MAKKTGKRIASSLSEFAKGLELAWEFKCPRRPAKAMWRLRFYRDWPTNNKGTSRRGVAITEFYSKESDAIERRDFVKNAGHKVLSFAKYQLV